ncbi:MAG: hypothetical protein A3C44_06235 [Gammaproteobacteria bacterium RIFCSPHIGHO2_02_FULL_39_13]|nr:MAG: hypothetical protein A3C44_06235 [Gammaproteobacteria bacterium RIFCSPHIGHO2_02_FULL_39_13]OGT49353.1 MAG: hypothetical protein A3E53_07300 [Gammaproteobacteria bacterium RIFCSPHIGHO2_12_FULL_39_24]
MKNFSITIINEHNLLSLEEICSATHAQEELILQLIEYHIIQPKGASKKNWQFDHLALKRAKLARNFYYDLEVNLAGIGLLLDLLEKIEMLEARAHRLK